MKYALIDNGEVTEPVTIPDPLPAWAEDVAAFLAKLYPGKSGWIEVPADTMAGATDNGDGTYTNPSAGSAPMSPNVRDAYEFKLRFTAAERKSIRAAAKSDADVEDFVDMLDTAAATGTNIKSDDAVLNEAMLALVTAELLTDDRRKEILGIVE